MTSSDWWESAPRGVHCGRLCPAGCVQGGGLVARPTRESPSPFTSLLSAANEAFGERDGGSSSAPPQRDSGEESAPPRKRNGWDDRCEARTSVTCHLCLRVPGAALCGEQPRTWALGQVVGPHPDPATTAGLSLLFLGTPLSRGHSGGDKRVVPAVKRVNTLKHAEERLPHSNRSINVSNYCNYCHFYPLKTL